MSKAALKPELEIDHSELYAVTEEVLYRFPHQSVVDRVGRVRAYAELNELYPDMPIYGDKLVDAICRLAISLDAMGDSLLAERLHEFVAGAEPSDE